MSTKLGEMLFAFHGKHIVEVLAMFDLHGVDCCEVRRLGESSPVIVRAQQLHATWAQLNGYAAMA